MIWKKKLKILIIKRYVWYNKRNINTRKEFSEINYIRLQGDMVHIKSNLIDTDGGIYLTVTVC